LSRESVLLQRRKWQPIIGMPALVPVPRKSSSTWPSGSVTREVYKRYFADGETAGDVAVVVDAGSRPARDIFAFAVGQRIAEILASALAERLQPGDDVGVIGDQRCSFARIGFEVVQRQLDARLDVFRRLPAADGDARLAVVIVRENQLPFAGADGVKLLAPVVIKHCRAASWRRAR
jgi:hypothetical protein